MKIHEYQARDLLASYAIPVPPGRMINSIDDAAAAFKEVTGGTGVPPVSGPLAVVKAQVHAGGRGKAGFVKLVKSPDEALAAARFMLTNRMKSPQTPAEGLEVSSLLIAAGVDIAERTTSSSRAAVPAAATSPTAAREEYYLAITTDRKTRRNILIASREGGVDIEHVAATNPAAIIKQPIDPILGLHPYQAREVASRLGFTGRHIAQAADVMLKLARLFIEKDCTLAEINPLVIATTAAPSSGSSPNAESRMPNASSSVIAIDAKFSFDDNALFRHKDIAALADPAEENPAETRANKFGLSYIALDGNIGCLVNGAGLAMATMDVIKLHGGDPANFLDVGGSASEEAVTEAFSIILSDPKVKGILVNIFGGIMKCDIIAQGIINAATRLSGAGGTGVPPVSAPGGTGSSQKTPVHSGFRVPLVVRLEGTNVEAGRKLLDAARANLPTLQAATDLADAAKKVVAAVR